MATYRKPMNVFYLTVIWKLYLEKLTGILPNKNYM